MEVEFVDITALKDSQPSTNVGLQEFADIEKLKDRDREKEKIFAIDSLNQFVLDGTIGTIDDARDVAYMTEQPSDSECNFETIPVIDITFSEPHSSAGITFNFVDDYPEEVKIQWFKNNISLMTVIHKPKSPDSTCYQEVTNYNHVVISFLKTRLPYQYIRLSYIAYGIWLRWGGDILQNAKIFEQVDTTSLTVPINTAEATILDKNRDFDISRDGGLWRFVQNKQRVIITEDIDKRIVPMGTFFINGKSWEDNKASFEMIDSVGIMDLYTFYDGHVYKGEKAGNILDDIFRAAEITRYTIDEDIYNIKLSGWLGIQTCREALQTVCLACGATADDSRSETIRVYTPGKQTATSITLMRKFNGNSKLELEPYTYGISTEYASYESIEEEPVEIYKGTLSLGMNMVAFDSAYAELEAINATITRYSDNYAYLKVEDDTKEVLLKGKRHIENKFILQQVVEEKDVNETENIVQIGTISLYNPESAKKLLNKLMDYYGLRKKLSLKFISEGEHSGIFVNISNRSGSTVTTLIENQSIDLTGGYICEASCRGFTAINKELWYCGDGMYINEIGGII